ncbi:MAG: flagellar motor switch phosphatase FliY [Eubacteriaceae bacterium]
MKENFLSQDEVDALLKKREAIEDEFVLGDTEKDIIGEIGNISMSTAATTLSSIINRKVMITTPRVTVIEFKKIIDECKIPKVVANIEFKQGFKGSNILMMDVSDAVIISDLMMGGNGTNVKTELTELELSAVAEAMNQMIGSASTSMATMTNEAIDIYPPDVSLWDKDDDIDYKKITTEKNVCKIAFDLTVEGLIESEIMQVYTMETVKDIVSKAMGGQSEKEEVEEIKEPLSELIEEDIQVEYDEKELQVEYEEEELEKKVKVQKPSFPPLTETKVKDKNPRNLNLIMDVPLEFSVVLGKTKKTIKEILTFTNGSVIELNKLADEALEIYVNGKLIALGEVVVINENFGIRITSILSMEQRVQGFK